MGESNNFLLTNGGQLTLQSHQLIYVGDEVNVLTINSEMLSSSPTGHCQLQ